MRTHRGPHRHRATSSHSHAVTLMLMQPSSHRPTRVHARAPQRQNEDPAKITCSKIALDKRPCSSCGREQKSRQVSTRWLAVSAFAQHSVVFAAREHGAVAAEARSRTHPKEPPSPTAELRQASARSALAKPGCVDARASAAANSTRRSLDNGENDEPCKMTYSRIDLVKRPCNSAGVSEYRAK